jgi:hypothetical protein
MPWQQDPASRITGDETGHARGSALVNAVAWGSEIEMLRVLRAVADAIGRPLDEVAKLARELSLADIAEQHGVTRAVVLDAVLIALRAGEPFAGLWHQRAELQRRAERVVDHKPQTQRRPREPQRRTILNDRHGPDEDGHLDTLA